MKCPKCGCKVSYCFNDDNMVLDDYEMQRCSACGTIFYETDVEEDGYEEEI